MDKKARWAGRNGDKDVVRGEIWQKLEDSGFAMGPVWSVIPNFIGADMAAWHLAQTEEWRRAKTVKCNPDPPQIPVRLRALYEGKMLYAPVPYLTREFPYLRIDPRALEKKGISFELAATSEGYQLYGERIEFEDVEPLDFCVVGSVAVGRGGGRTGKGAGFADFETGIFRELGTITSQTPMATTIHSSQLVDDARVVIEAHDSPLDFIATERELIVTHNEMPRPAGVIWEQIREDQYETIPFLRDLHQRMVARRAEG